MAEVHDLTLSNSEPGVCTCGEVFEGKTGGSMVKAWETHLQILSWSAQARIHALNEREARLSGETVIKHLHSLGMSTRAISDAIGLDPKGNVMVSPTLVQRLVKDEYVQTPRRRRKG